MVRLRVGRARRTMKGEFAAIDNRQKDLQAYLSDRVEPRGNKLLEILNRHDPSLQLTDVLDFLCVASVEYLSPNYPKLWYGETPRVLTAEELVAFVKDDIGFHAVLKQLADRPRHPETR
jgi:hypothetical protein